MWDQYQIISLSIKNHQRSRVSIQGRGPVLLALLNPGQSGEKKSSKSQMVHSPWHHLPRLKKTFIPFFDVFLWLHGWTFSKYQIQGLESKPFQAPAETCMTFFEEIFLKYRMALFRLWCFSWQKIDTSNFNKINKPQLPNYRHKCKQKQGSHGTGPLGPLLRGSLLPQLENQNKTTVFFDTSFTEKAVESCCAADAEKRLHGEPRAIRKGKTVKSADRLSQLEHLLFLSNLHILHPRVRCQEMSKDVQKCIKNPEMTRDVKPVRRLRTPNSSQSQCLTFWFLADSQQGLLQLVHTMPVHLPVSWPMTSRNWRKHPTVTLRSDINWHLK